MTNSQRVLLEIIRKEDSFLESSTNPLLQVAAEELGDIFVDVAFFVSALQYLKEEYWLYKKAQGFVGFVKFSTSYFNSELKPLSYLQDVFNSDAFDDLKSLSKLVSNLEKKVVEYAKTRSFEEQKKFAIQALSRIALLFRFEKFWIEEKRRLGLNMGLSLYRTFDRLDELFELDYAADIGMTTRIDEAERLFEGAGEGVQSGYSTVLAALDCLNLSSGDRIVDLGSGYGRVGLIVGLLRSDLNFLGYEYVGHRVDISRATTKKFELEDHVRFVEQDLSLKSFCIPEAEVYYLYDPFSEETYKYVVSQLVEVSRKKPVVIVTKGNARQWLTELALREGWQTAEEHDNGNLCIFRSPDLGPPCSASPAC